MRYIPISDFLGLKLRSGQQTGSPGIEIRAIYYSGCMAIYTAPETPRYSQSTSVYWIRI